MGAVVSLQHLSLLTYEEIERDLRRAGDDLNMDPASGFSCRRVFEAFVVNFVRRHRKAILPPDLRDCDLLPQARGASLCLSRCESQRRQFRGKSVLPLAERI